MSRICTRFDLLTFAMTFVMGTYALGLDSGGAL